MSADETKLSSTVTVARYRELEQDDNRKVLGDFIRDRFNERYFCPIESTPKERKNGFTIMAVCCIVIETLESYYQGKPDTKGKSEKMFTAFFERDTPLKVFGGKGDWFYKDIRCGILHQSEARKGWRILRSGRLLNQKEKSINATRFINELRAIVDAYANQLQHDNDLWELFKKKMNAVCENCVSSTND